MKILTTIVRFSSGDHTINPADLSKFLVTGDLQPTLFPLRSGGSSLAAEPGHEEVEDDAAGSAGLQSAGMPALTAIDLEAAPAPPAARPFCFNLEP
jgi:hypothetical protein